jgi:hypothetical protein
MICFLALIVFAVLGIFSAKYRDYAREAFDCVFRRITLRKCNTSFDKKMKMKLTGKIMKRNQKLAKVVFKHFELISWIFTLLLIVSLIYSVAGIYNFIVYQNCEGPHGGQCIYSEIIGSNESISCGSEHCAQEGCECEEGCSEENNFKACDGNCECVEEVCG